MILIFKDDNKTCETIFISNTHLIADLVVVDTHSFVDDDAGKVSAEGQRKRVERGEVFHRLWPHQLENWEPVALRHPEIQRVDASCFHLDQQALKKRLIASLFK